MRLMLGFAEQPSLLVSVDDNYNPECFKFWVVNGCWNGRLTSGYLTVFYPDGTGISYIDKKLEILLSNQERLRGEYQDVFDNWYNPEYVGPVPKEVPADWDDEIPF